jgi:hypothetical protein
MQGIERLVPVTARDEQADWPRVFKAKPPAIPIYMIRQDKHRGSLARDVSRERAAPMRDDGDPDTSEMELPRKRAPSPSPAWS